LYYISSTHLHHRRGPLHHGARDREDAAPDQNQRQHGGFGNARCPTPGGDVEVGDGDDTWFITVVEGVNPEAENLPRCDSKVYRPRNPAGVRKFGVDAVEEVPGVVEERVIGGEVRVLKVNDTRRDRGDRQISSSLETTPVVPPIMLTDKPPSSVFAEPSALVLRSVKLPRL